MPNLRKQIAQRKLSQEGTDLTAMKLEIDFDVHTKAQGVLGRIHPGLLYAFLAAQA